MTKPAVEPTTAIRHYREAVASSPGCVESRSRLGYLYSITGALEEALAVLGEARRIDAAHLGAAVNLAAAFEDAGELAKALALYEEIVVHHPQSPVLLNNYAGALRRACRLDAALPVAQSACTFGPAMPQPQNTLGRVHLARGEFPQSLWFFTAAITRSPTYAVAHLNRGRAYAALGRHDLAGREYTWLKANDRPELAETLRADLGDVPRARRRATGRR